MRTASQNADITDHIYRSQVRAKLSALCDQHFPDVPLAGFVVKLEALIERGFDPPLQCCKRRFEKLRRVSQATIFALLCSDNSADPGSNVIRPPAGKIRP